MSQEDGVVDRRIGATNSDSRRREIYGDRDRSGSALRIGAKILAVAMTVTCADPIATSTDPIATYADRIETITDQIAIGAAMIVNVPRTAETRTSRVARIVGATGCHAPVPGIASAAPHLIRRGTL